MIARETTFDKSKYLIENFDRALSEGWIEVYYQPIIRAANGKVCDEEALVRWDDPIMGVLNPLDFIPILEAVNLIHVLDLYVLEQVLIKMETQAARGLHVVTTAINLSQIDFYSCDIVDEVRSRVEGCNVPKEKIAIEIAESAIGRSNEYVIAQIQQFKQMGFKIWMDDYGNGDSAPLLMKRLNFDLVKINIGIINQLYDESVRIIVTEMVRMAMAFGIDTAAEGVETEEQISFLKDVGCSKLQGFFYCKPINKDQIFARYEEGKAIGFENPVEEDYYNAVGKISLYDLSFAKAGNTGLDDYFDTLPMAILETDEEEVSFVRGNKQFKYFIRNNFSDTPEITVYNYKNHERSVGFYSMNMIRQCARDGERKIIDDRTKDDKMVQLFMQKISQNPVTKKAAIVVAILSMTEQQPANDTLTYNYIARALSEDYIDLFFVDLTTDEFVEYSPDGFNRDVTVERRGKDFFGEGLAFAKKNIVKEDWVLFDESFCKEHISDQIDKNGSFTLTYRNLIEGVPTYVMLKAVKIRTSANKIIIGISNVDAQMKQKESMERIKEERLTFSRISALSGDIICIYTVDPQNNSYIKYKSSPGFEKFDLSDGGRDFFEETRKNSKWAVYPEDVEGFLRIFDKKTMLEQINNGGIFVFNYRLNMDGVPNYVCLKATIIEEMDGPRLLVGLINVDTQVRKEMEYAETLLAAEAKAVRDELTGVKNKRAYSDAETTLNGVLENNKSHEFAIAVFDINGLKQVNDTKGHQAGDLFIKAGCSIICDTFTYSPVFRIGGDEFAVICQGKDYHNIGKLIDKIDKINKKNKKNGDVTIAYGYSVNNDDACVSDVFKRADSAMYENKTKMKKEA